MLAALSAIHNSSSPGKIRYAADAVLRAVLFDESARQRAGRLPPPAALG
jgi:hypothetical protein